MGVLYPASGSSRRKKPICAPKLPPLRARPTAASASHTAVIAKEPGREGAFRVNGERAGVVKRQQSRSCLASYDGHNLASPPKEKRLGLAKERVRLQACLRQLGIASRHHISAAMLKDGFRGEMRLTLCKTCVS